MPAVAASHRADVEMGAPGHLSVYLFRVVGRKLWVTKNHVIGH